MGEVALLYLLPTNGYLPDVCRLPPPSVVRTGFHLIDIFFVRNRHLPNWHKITLRKLPFSKLLVRKISLRKIPFRKIHLRKVTLRKIPLHSARYLLVSYVCIPLRNIPCISYIYRSISPYESRDT